MLGDGGLACFVLGALISCRRIHIAYIYYLIRHGKKASDAPNNGVLLVVSWEMEVGCMDGRWLYRWKAAAQMEVGCTM